MENNNVT